ncbi:MAG: hypothetical protein ACFFDG_05210 [Promethearchaeota archaeon]
MNGKELNEKNLQVFALNVCYECRAPRFGLTCDKEVAGVNHLVSLFDSFDLAVFEGIVETLKLFIKKIQEE